ncbi:MAG TPA: tRNA uridine-5-carboxymethylaminomethyl(34) synthesis enzyme MnmG [Candidatus Saccharimonadales bacterium]|nr:tRNA uridine-5-carboxymethylaminomethyl(34) synthesis enzyme MnmG [Candidatus Saccharimonadales bacterium]
MNKTNHFFDVIVVGGGHAGVEAAYASAKMGCKTLLLTIDKNKIGLMPCNPSIGGVGKGHIVFEISALGGLMPQLCSKTYLQARMLNTKKGPAVQGLRLQIDKDAYSKLAGQTLQNTQNLTIAQEMVDEILVENGSVRGIRCESGTIFDSNQVVLTTGTFLNGLIHVGEKNYPAGRRDEKAATQLSNFLTKLNLKLGRLKTGTPPRLATHTIDFSQLEKQEAEPLDSLFEFDPIHVENTHDCYIARTNTLTHQIIKDNLHTSAMYSGNIKGIGPRYCPSVEDKISRFADKNSHHIFVEPETKDYVEAYPSGISTSLPEAVQEKFIHSIAGFEHATIVKFGYAVEYDFVHPNQLNHALEVKTIPGLFLAGQINGTTGYEEAAGQGILAGINAALKSKNQSPCILDRQESYIGVMIDDLVTLGVDEPYRMFTSRAERRLILRQDNAFLRLMPKAYELGLIEQDLYQRFLNEKAELEKIIEEVDKKFSNAKMAEYLLEEPTAQELAITLGYNISSRNALSLFSHVKYKNYIKRELAEIEKNNKYKDMPLPHQDLIKDAPGISTELKQKLLRHKPATIGQAGLIPGMTPAAIALLILLVRKPELVKKNDLY